MTEFMAGGRRRIDRVLDPGYLDELAARSLDEVRDLRAEADQEEVDLSYARRLLQGRIDILKAEQERRDGRGPLGGGLRGDAAIVEALKRILTDERGPAQGGGRHLGVQPSRVGEHRREAERAVADVGGSDLAGLDDEALAAAVERLTDIERRVSRSRRQVQGVVDSLTAEIARRYRLEQVDVTERIRTS